ncbi:hypothetical protein OG216_12745 [Streptomycetaceae bacterium NBC_01309]
MAALAAVVAALAMTVSGCGPLLAQGAKKLVPVLAEALLVAGADAFMDRATAQDRTDVTPVGKGGSHEGDEVGLYGGSLKASVCDKKQLIAFLTAPANAAKATEWARVMGISVDEIPEFINGLTPVTLRFDTLVKNHRFSKGKAKPYESLLPAGMAVLVRANGLPAVKCNCGNPLGTTKTKIENIEVKISDPKWKGRYRPDKVRKVTPVKEEVATFKLTNLDVADDTSIERPQGSTGDADQAGAKIVPEPDLMLSVAEVAPGAGYEATASNFRPGETVRFGPKDAGDAKDKPYAVATADESGTATAAITTDADTKPGDKTVYAHGTESGLTASAELTVAKPEDIEPTSTESGGTPGGPQLALAPASVADGGPFTAKATGFEPGESVVFTRTGDAPAKLGQAEADDTGTATLKVTDDQGPGTYTLQAKGADSGTTAEAALTVKGGGSSPSTRAPTATMTLRPATVAVGGDVDIVLSGFKAGEDVEITRTGVSAGTVAVATADSSGKVTVTEYAGDTSGTSTVKATGATSGRAATAKLTVTTGVGTST